MTAYWGVYRILKNGEECYIPRSCTHSEKLARELAADFSAGRVIRPDGSEAAIVARPHIAKPVREI